MRIKIKTITNTTSSITTGSTTNTAAGVIADAVKMLGNAAVQLLYPRRCPVCDGIVRSWGEKACPDCLSKLRPLAAPWCMQCGKKLTGEAEYCKDCGTGKHSFNRGRALYEYGSVAVPIYRFKYGGRREYADFFGEQMAEYLGDFIRTVQPEALIPIPLHPRRRAVRGFNQAELLARSVGVHMELPVYADLLSRVKDTVPLKRLNKKDRQNNLKKAFNIKGNDVKLKTILIVDDIYTTGATIDEAAKVLKSAGVEHIYFVALACGTGI